MKTKSQNRSERRATERKKQKNKRRTSFPRLGILLGSGGVIVIGFLLLNIFLNPEKSTKPNLVNPPRYLLEKARELNAISKYDEAIEMLERHLMMYPNTRNLYFDLGALYGNKGDIAKAAKYFKKEITINPDHQFAYGHLGLALERLGNLQEALKYQKMQAAHNIDWEAQHKVGTLLVQLDQQEEAVRAFKKAIEINPEQPEPLVDLGKIYMQWGDLEAAKNLFVQAVKNSPMHPDANYNLGRLLIRLGNKEEGQKLLDRFRGLAKLQDRVDHYEQSSRLQGSSQATHYRYGEMLLKQQKYEEAMQAYKNAARLDSTFWLAQLRIGMIYLKTRQFKKAADALTTANKLKPDNFDIKFRLGQAYLYLKQRDVALKYLGEAKKIQAFGPENSRILAEIFFKNGYPNDGWRLLIRYIKKDKQDHRSRFLLAIYLHRYQKFEQAIQYYSEAIQIDPSLPSYVVACAIAKMKLGQSEGIIDMLRQFSSHQIKVALNKFNNLPGAELLRAELERSAIVSFN